MTTAAKGKSRITYPAAVRFFEDISGLLNKTAPLKGVTARDLVKRLKNAPKAEIAVVYEVLQEMSAEVGSLRMQVDVQKSAAPQVSIETALRIAQERSGEPMSNEQSVKEGNGFIVQMGLDSTAALRERIEHNDLILSKEIQEKLGISRQSVSSAIKDGRLFAIVGPSGTNYYPAFYADSKYDRRAIERVSKQLGALPATVKYHFFTTKAFSLGSKTPLDALAEGRLDAVLVAAAAYAEQ
jgi:hypothetical protein